MKPCMEHVTDCVRFTAAEPAPGKARERAPIAASYVVVMLPVNCRLVHVVEADASSRRVPAEA